VNKAEADKLKLLKVEKFIAIPGKGVRGDIAGVTYIFGNDKMVSAMLGFDKVRAQKESLETAGKTVMVLADSKQVIGLIAVADTVKKHSKDAIAKLQSMNIATYMLTGDNARTAAAVGRELDIQNVISEVLPEEKSLNVKELQAAGHVVAFIGDGVNDSVALAQSDIGIAMGSGTDVAIESGDIVLVKNEINDVASAIALSKATMAKIKQNLFWAFIYNIVGIPVAAGVLYSSTGILLRPEIAGLAMALSSVSVLTNSMLLRTKRL
jgi:Cu+-exporting ATPase